MTRTRRNQYLLLALVVLAAALIAALGGHGGWS
jgi:hypothetical protein